jgi:dihydroxyacetone kinase-like protein
MRMADAVLDVETLNAWLREANARIAADSQMLSELDGAIGDGDHGANMARGFAAVVAKLGTPADPAALLRGAGMTLIGTVGGAAGPLYGSMFIEMARSAAGAAGLGLDAWRHALAAGLAGIVARGKAGRGDKTMVDALAPAVEVMAGETALLPALEAAARAAAAGAEATAPWVARKGRASYLGERAIGHRDPGATSMAILLAALAAAAARRGA